MSTPASDCPSAQRFAPNHPWDRNFFLVMIALAWVGIIRGFGGEIAKHLENHEPAFALLVHFHAVVFVSWLILFTVQIFLIRVRKPALHMRLGFALVWLAGLMVIVGPATALTVQHRAMGSPKADPAFLSVQLIDMLAFAGLTGAAILLRKRVAAHKRLILLGTLYITDAGFARWLAGWVFGLMGGEHFWSFWVAFHGGPNVLIALVGIYDLVTRRRFHPAYLAGVAWVFAMEMLVVGLYFTPAWTVLAKRLIAAWPG